MSKKKVERVVVSKYFNDLPDQVKTKVVSTLADLINDTYGFKPSKKQLGEVLYELKSVIDFVITPEGKKIFRLRKDSEDELAKYLGDAFAKTAKHDPNIMERVILSMVKRNEDSERLKI